MQGDGIRQQAGPPAAAATPTAAYGLSREQVAERKAKGLLNDLPDAPTRTVGEIIRANVFTRFNYLLGSMLLIVLLVAPKQDALFGLVIISNTLIGIYQEVRAKRTLDRLSVIGAPHAAVVREGDVRETALREVVLDDVLEVHPGDQIVVDGTVLTARGLETDESLVTGESEPIVKEPGDDVLSGSFVSAGTCRYRATRVGREAYAAELTEQAKRFTLVTSELRDGINRILALVIAIMIPTATLLLISQLRHTELPTSAALRNLVAGTVAMVPEGLVLLTSIAFAVGVVRLGRRQVLVQELPAVETLARVDVVCFDKTGTLTDGELTVTGFEPCESHDGENDLPDAGDLEAALGAVAASDPAPNATQRALSKAFAPPEGWLPTATVPFSSARKWSAASYGDRGTWLLGAPEVLLDQLPLDHPVRVRADGLAEEGQRVILLAFSKGPSDTQLPADLHPAALITITERLRDDAEQILDYLSDQAVALKVISGDHPRTVGAVARQVGVPGAERPVDMREHGDDPGALAAVVTRNSVFGRTSPRQKRAMILALQARGRVVAVVGDGVNDVLALKESDLGIAMGSGTSATRAVAQLVLLDGRFARLPEILAEGRRVIANIERVASLFLTKSVYAMLLSLAVGVAGLQFPFFPRHLTLVGSLTVGIPAFFLALEPNFRRARAGFVRRTLIFAIPAGAVAAAATFSGFWLADTTPGIADDQVRTMATVTLLGVGLLVLRLISLPLNPMRASVLVGMSLSFLVVLATPWTHAFFALEPPPITLLLAAVGIVALTGLAMEGARRGIDLVTYTLNRQPGEWTWGSWNQRRLNLTRYFVGQRRRGRAVRRR